MVLLHVSRGLKLTNKHNLKLTEIERRWVLLMTVAMPSPSPMNEYVKDISAAIIETHAMPWRSGMNDITIWTTPNITIYILASYLQGALCPSLW